MTYFNPICADVGTRNCPCPLAETGDCLVCSRLSGARECSCRWAGVCVYNEYMQNGSMVRTKRKARSTEILQRLRQGDDLLMLQLRVPRGFALEASQPGSFLFLKPPGAPEMASVPVSVMAADVEHESLWVILKIISAKTKALAACEDFLEMRGIYRSGLLGKGVAGILDLHDPGVSVRKRWLILTKGVGFAPAVNLIRWAAGRIDIHVIADPEKVGDDVIRQQFRAWQPEAYRSEGGRFRLEFQSLAKLLEQPAAASPLQQTDSTAAAPPAAALHTSGLYDPDLQQTAAAPPLQQTDSTAAAPPATALHTSGSHDPDLQQPAAASPLQQPDSTAAAPPATALYTSGSHDPDLQQPDYDRIFLLTSDYYIKRLSAVMKIPPEKLVFCNNFHLCCGEGICGACGHVDAEGNLRKMCKCREFSALDLLLPE